MAKLLGIETYAPSQTVIKQWSDRKKKVEVAVIPMVIFAEVSTEEEVLVIKKHSLILKVLTLPGQKTAAHIPGRQITQLKFMLSESDEPVEFVAGDFQVADKVRVVRGRLKGLEGTVQRAADGQTYIIITINMLGGAKVTVAPSDIELIHND